MPARVGSGFRAGSGARAAEDGEDHRAVLAGRQQRSLRAGDRPAAGAQVQRHRDRRQQARRRRRDRQRHGGAVPSPTAPRCCSPR